MKRTQVGICFAWAALFALSSVVGQEPRRSGVGVPSRIEQLVLPGTELEVIPGDRKDPVVVRIVRSNLHGTDMRYDIEYYGLDPGTYDLRKYLRRKDGTTTTNLAGLQVVIEAKLPAGQITPNELAIERGPWLGGYRLALWLGGAAWVIGLGAILFLGRRRRLAQAAADAKPLTFADRLRPLVEKAQAGQITQSQRAELERTLLAYWRDRLNLRDVKPTEAFAQMREHPQAGPLLMALETWLHRPGPAPDIDIGKLLEPYRDMPAEPIESQLVGGRAS